MKGKLGREGALSRSAKYLLVGFLAVFFLMPLYWMSSDPSGRWWGRWPPRSCFRMI